MGRVPPAGWTVCKPSHRSPAPFRPGRSTTRRTRAASIAFSGTGLRRMGLPEGGAGFLCAGSFKEGMFQEDRLRRLGDRRGGEWLDTVVDGGPLWSAQHPPAGATAGPAGRFRRAADRRTGSYAHLETFLTVHALLLLVAEDERWPKHGRNMCGSSYCRTASRWCGALNCCSTSRTAASAASISASPTHCRSHFPTTRRMPCRWAANRQNRIPSRACRWASSCSDTSTGTMRRRRGPLWLSTTRRARPDCPDSEKAEGFRDLGLNGSYLVVRELKQDVAGFWRSMDAAAASIRARDPGHTQHVTAQWLAERAIGRDRDGHLLCPGNAKLSACSDGSPDSSFRFFDRDAWGAGCPPGSHVRRAFPRDALAPDRADSDTLLQAANNHRILRRGRKFGTKIAGSGQRRRRGPRAAVHVPEHRHRAAI